MILGLRYTRTVKNMYQVAFRLVIFGTLFFSDVLGHGRLIEPPSRASMWRYGFNTPHNYNDNELYCGGFSRQWNRNKGKCGICGDPWDVKPPRPNETGGKYGNSIIVRKYRTGSIIPVQVELTANHHGYFEFRLCPMAHAGTEVTDDCLDQHVLIEESGTPRYYPGPGNKIFESHYKLPDDVTCSQCVFQWRYVAGNNWGKCDNGTEAVGCGPQEEFRACADISIGDNQPPLPPRPITPKTNATGGTSTTKHAQPSPTEPSLVSDISGPYWVVSLVIAGTSLLVILAAFALLYTYYYHAGKAKQWLRAGKLLTPDNAAPIAPPRQRKHQNSISHSPLDA
ncbi:uncharacterized protein LOC124178807 isoform X1 [Neodiprion fabricii]|uniref:uncharacterized protein LOC124178807 isoform X1 n=2 Tax=Neodiprion fabricii TaxID=2872261 RepID=UPI001ED91644|nr:uncharacterized protein LOC124178807 isoform X1 [Neodiprion fabricii]